MPTVTMLIKYDDITRFPRKMRMFRSGIVPVTKATTEELANEVVRFAKRFAPVWRGALRRSIRFEQIRWNRFDIIAGEGLARNYAWFQEAGYTGHYVSLKHPAVRAWFEAHATGEISHPGRRLTSIFVQKFTPYVLPAVEQVRPSQIPVAKKNIEKLMKSVFE